MGTPHLRWREMHQSLRPSVMAVMRLKPDAGCHSTPLMASKAAARNPSTLANHWLVALSGGGREQVEASESVSVASHGAIDVSVAHQGVIACTSHSVRCKHECTRA